MTTTDIQDTVYHKQAAVAIIILNVISFLTLAFVLSIYLAKWKKIASFPMRLVSIQIKLVLLSMLCMPSAESICHYA